MVHAQSTSTLSHGRYFILVVHRNPAKDLKWPKSSQTRQWRDVKGFHGQPKVFNYLSFHTDRPLSRPSVLASSSNRQPNCPSQSLQFLFCPKTPHLGPFLVWKNDTPRSTEPERHPVPTGPLLVQEDAYTRDRLSISREFWCWAVRSCLLATG